jgi:hypothetical protein
VGRKSAASSTTSVSKARAAPLGRQQQQLRRRLAEESALRRRVCRHRVSQPGLGGELARQFVKRQHGDARHVGQCGGQRLGQGLVEAGEQHRPPLRRVLARQRHGQQRLAGARAPLHQQPRLAAQQAQRLHLLIGGLVHGAERVVHTYRQRNQIAAVRRQQLGQRPLLGAVPRLRVWRRLAKNARQRRQRVGQVPAVQQKCGRRRLGARQWPAPHQIGKPHSVRHREPIGHITPQPLPQLVGQRIPVSPRLGKGRLLHRRAGPVEPLPIPHGHRPGLDLEDDQAVVGVEHHPIRLAHLLAGCSGQQPPLHRRECPPRRWQRCERGEHAGFGAGAGGKTPRLS